MSFFTPVGFTFAVCLLSLSSAATPSETRPLPSGVAGVLDALNTVRVVGLENGTLLAIKQGSRNPQGGTSMTGVVFSDSGSVVTEVNAAAMLTAVPGGSVRPAPGHPAQVYSGRTRGGDAVASLGWRDENGRSQNGFVLAKVTPEGRWQPLALAAVKGAVRDVSFGPEDTILAVTWDEVRRRHEDAAPSLTLFSRSGAVLGEFLPASKVASGSATLRHLGGSRYALTDLSTARTAFFELARDGTVWSLSMVSVVCLDVAVEPGTRLVAADPRPDGSVLAVRVRLTGSPYSEVLRISPGGVVVQVVPVTLPWNVAWFATGVVHGIADGPDGPMEETLPEAELTGVAPAGLTPRR